ncbi:acyl-CoA dehydrogenase family protein [Marinospirillum alkaliphilum]|uniref:3-methylmercaptopropionyl-CoA dehydrogenase n=1 Tax=Marinospirillum alkaliphilum DSM 21637 TaxID=1122209 RepID=A0A1K1THE1_9GAMM|nr:acyl-CoA dehydrogenase family protein [Marinospirillum alkaliphilum]SFW99836.1 Acyl-CoA dehydrogenase [Marinospirillum alkaliphilum DSM 21637]
MWRYQAPLKDMQFVLKEWLQADSFWQQHSQYQQLDAETADQILEEAGRFCSEVLEPLNGSGDLEGCRLEQGEVKTPAGFPQAWQAFVDAGWPAMACSEDWGGQQLPQVLQAAVTEMIYACNHAFGMYSGIAHGAYECISRFASAELQDRYLPKLVSGEWLPTMCLTEPQAGSDLGQLRCKAESDGKAHRLTGSKIFISGGDQDLTDNIIHLVLARLPDAPVGTRGISLFLVPKWLDHPGGQRNAVYCDSLEKKMGIRGSATCSLSFQGATGWLIGEPHAGLQAMFSMMNAARLSVAQQGLGHVEASRQRAAAYALERTQMRAPPPPGELLRDPAPLHWHPAMRRRLLELRAFSEGMRVIGYWTAQLLDQQDEALAGLLTPVVKAFFTDRSFRLASSALQVFGGYGYTHEYGIEQTLRDSRIAMIYEGTNEIQANDLLLRKVLADQGQQLQRLLALVDAEIQQATSHSELDAYWRHLQQLTQALQQLVEPLQKTPDAERPLRAADDFLQLMGLYLLGYGWLRSARLALQAKGSAGPVFYQHKLATADFYFRYLLPEADYRIRMVEASCYPLAHLSWIE